MEGDIEYLIWALPPDFKGIRIYPVLIRIQLRQRFKIKDLTPFLMLRLVYYARGTKL